MLRLLGVRIFDTIERKESEKLALGALKIVPKRARRHRASPLVRLILSRLLQLNLLFAAP